MSWTSLISASVILLTGSDGFSSTSAPQRTIGRIIKQFSLAVDDVLSASFATVTAIYGAVNESNCGRSTLSLRRGQAEGCKIWLDVLPHPAPTASTVSTIEFNT